MHQQPIASIAHIRNANSVSVIDLMAINARFASYYSALYSSKVDYSREELDFFDQIAFPTLTAMAHERLNSTIILEEVQPALGKLQAGKTAGVDVIPPEFYKQYGDQLTPKLHEMIVKTLKEGTLPASMADAIIAVIPKPGKDPELPVALFPCSMLMLRFLLRS